MLKGGVRYRTTAQCSRVGFWSAIELLHSAQGWGSGMLYNYCTVLKGGVLECYRTAAQCSRVGFWSAIELLHSTQGRVSGVL